VEDLPRILRLVTEEASHVFADDERVEEETPEPETEADAADDDDVEAHVWRAQS
jgi:hypothetical protein